MILMLVPHDIPGKRCRQLGRAQSTPRGSLWLHRVHDQVLLVAEWLMVERIPQTRSARGRAVMLAADSSASGSHVWPKSVWRQDLSGNRGILDVMSRGSGGQGRP